MTWNNSIKSSLITSIFAALLLSMQPVFADEDTTYDNMFISYYTPEDVTSLAKYAKEQGLAGFILWEFRGDTSFNDKSSLLKALNSETSDSNPLIMGYWSNWGVYSNDSNSRAIPHPAYRVPGSLDNNGNKAENSDFTQKLDGMNAIAYAFLEAQTENFTYYDNDTGQMVQIKNKTPDKIGTLYFNDPWADLSKPKDNDTQDALCAKDAAICNFALTNRNTAIPNEQGMLMGNFNAFAVQNNSHGKLAKYISIGGYGHDATFEDTFKAANGIENFTTSAAAIINTYGIEGIDLDYENPDMTHEQAQKYAELIQALRKKLPNTKISVALLGNPKLLETIGKDTLKIITDNIDHLNFMTYDFHGAFDYSADGKGITGFITNIYKPDNAPKGYKFSIDTLISKARELGVPLNKVSVGIPAYGRALTGIDMGSEELLGLFQPIPKSANGIPRGDLDAKDCNTSIPLGDNACSGSFQYKYIVENMLGKDAAFTSKTWPSQDAMANGTNAFAKSWAPAVKKGLKLEITNIGDHSNTAFSVIISNGKATFAPGDYFNAGTDKMYSADQTGDIANLKDLTIKWVADWGQGDNNPHGECTSFTKDSDKDVTFFTQPTHLMIKVTPENGKFTTSCTLKLLK